MDWIRKELGANGIRLELAQYEAGVLATAIEGRRKLVLGRLDELHGKLLAGELSTRGQTMMCRYEEEVEVLNDYLSVYERRTKL